MQHGKRFVYAVDEVVVNFSVNLLVEQRFFYGAAEFARLCKEAVLSYAAAVKTCNGVYFPFVGFVPGFKRLFSDLLRWVLHEHTVTSVRERNRLAVHLDGSPIHFAVVQPAEGFAEISRHFARVCEQLFRLGGKYVRFSRFDSAQGVIVFFELRLRHDFVQSLFVKPAKLGLHERGGDGILVVIAQNLVPHGLNVGVFAVLVHFHVGVAYRFFKKLLDVSGQLEKLVNAFFVVQLSLVILDFADKLARRRAVLFEQRLVWINSGQIPRVFDRYVLSVFVTHCLIVSLSVG